MFKLDNHTRQKVLYGALAVVVLASVGTAFYYKRQATILRTNPAKAVEKEVKQVIEAVSRLVVLPEGETPTVATVADKEKLKDQVFFANAKVGDKVLIYTNAKKAILYNPEADKIVEIAPLNIGN